MSEALKVEIAKELGFYDVVQKEGWGGIKARDAGNMVKRAIEIAEASLTKNSRGSGWGIPQPFSSHMGFSRTGTYIFSKRDTIRTLAENAGVSE